MDDVGVFGVEDVGGGAEVFGVVVVGVFGVVVGGVVASCGEDVLGDELGDEFAELAHVEGAAHAHAHVTGAATSSATSVSAKTAPAAPVVIVGSSVVVGAMVVRGTASALAAEGEAGTEGTKGVVMGFRASVIGWGPLTRRGRWGWALEGVVMRAFLGWATGIFAGFRVVGSSEGV